MDVTKSRGMRLIIAGAMSAGVVGVASSQVGASGSPIALTGCNQVVTTNAVLNSDLVCTLPPTGPLNGITAGADGITINLRGHTITAPPTFNSGTAGGIGAGAQNGNGVIVVDHSHVTVLNGKLSGWTTGVKIRSSGEEVPGSAAAANVVTGITVLDCGATGASRRGLDIAEPGADGNTLKGNSILGAHCTTGIRFHESNDNTLTDNVVSVGTTGVGDAFILDIGHGNTIARNRFSSNAANGMVLGQSESNMIVDNIIENNALRGVLLGGPISNELPEATSSNNVLRGNVITGNGGNGVQVGPSGTATQLQGATGNVIQANTVIDNGGMGIDLSNGAHLADAIQNTRNPIGAGSLDSGNSVIANNVIGNGVAGVVVSSGSNTLTGNNSVSNTGPGITVDGLANVLQGNLAAHNTGGGIIAVAGNTDGGGNKGLANGVSAQNCVFGSSACR